MKFDYKWNLSDGYPAKGVKYHGTTVMSTFACGGGSTMGYKLAGYDVVAANDIDPQMARVYKANHEPKQFFECSIKDLLNRDDLPQVDVLDGSPPCSVFSMAGSREKAWQKDKMFREGQAKQVLDDLFFDFIKLVEKMKPKIVIAENVKGMLQGNAKWYTQEVVKLLKALGYKVKVFLLNAATMGVPQKRQRVFFIAHKTDRDIDMHFDEKPIAFGSIINNRFHKKLSEKTTEYWSWCEQNGIADFGKYAELHTGKRKMFNHRLVFNNRVCDTVAANCQLTVETEPAYINDIELALVGSFPQDYNYLSIKPSYLIGMSVPPVMMAQVAYEVYKQLIEVT
jgi:DNA (cytosine-5)-methyltransferase 1